MTMRKFRTWDLVRLKDTFPNWMKHYPGAGKMAIVLGSSAEEGLGDARAYEPGYCLYIKNHGAESWYDESLLTYLAHDPPDVMAKWEEEDQITSLEERIASLEVALKQSRLLAHQALDTLEELVKGVEDEETGPYSALVSAKSILEKRI